MYPSTSQPNSILRPTEVTKFKPRSLSAAQKREIHLIEDEESEEQVIFFIIEETLAAEENFYESGDILNFLFFC